MCTGLIFNLKPGTVLARRFLALSLYGRKSHNANRRRTLFLAAFDRPKKKR